jgi:hypothetical protein
MAFSSPGGVGGISFHSWKTDCQALLPGERSALQVSGKGSGVYLRPSWQAQDPDRQTGHSRGGGMRGQSPRPERQAPGCRTAGGSGCLNARTGHSSRTCSAWGC